MKTLIMTFYMILFLGVSAAEEKKEKPKAKTYTETEFHKKVEEEVKKKLGKLNSGYIVDFSHELLEKEKKLRLKELEVSKKEEEYKQSVEDLRKKIKVFESKQGKFLSCVEEVDKKHSKRISHMVDVVAGMRPANAAQVLSVQDPEISVQILGLLNPAKVSKIFNSMDKEISARLQKQYMTMKK